VRYERVHLAIDRKLSDQLLVLESESVLFSGASLISYYLQCVRRAVKKAVCLSFLPETEAYGSPERMGMGDVSLALLGPPERRHADQVV
jgi:hypothetical protein